MSHYFTKKPNVTSKPQVLRYTYNDKEFTFTSDQGVFSKEHVDFATDVLLRNVSLPTQGTVLDLGCGYGVIGIVIAKISDLNVTLSDVNQRALDLTRANALTNEVEVTIVESDGFENLDNLFDLIITNPPIRIGKSALYPLLLQAIAHLKETGTLLFVMHKKHGVESAIRFLSKEHKVSVIKKHKGFHVVACNKR